jgi:hypothetical protein
MHPQPGFMATATSRTQNIENNPMHSSLAGSHRRDLAKDNLAKDNLTRRANHL